MTYMQSLTYASTSRKLTINPDQQEFFQFRVVLVPWPFRFMFIQTRFYACPIFILAFLILQV
jgi:hypothetical protein